MAVVAAVSAALGAFHLYAAIVLRWNGVGFGPALAARRGPSPSRQRDWLAQAGLAGIAPGEFSAVCSAFAAGGAVVGFVVFGGVLAPLLVGAFAGTFPLASYRHSRAVRRRAAQEAWPRLIEQMRILTSSVGRSIPQALFEVGSSAPDELRPAFIEAKREWLLSTDFPRTLDVLKARLADPTADATCETLLIAHELGGADLDRRLAALAEDRRLDTRDRKDAVAKQAGARFARKFVLIVPLGMALVGMSIGNGRTAYETAAGQAAVATALAMVLVCWIWAGHIMRLPDEDRVFHR